MVTDIRQEFKEILKSSDWMDEETKKSALKKVDELSHHIGYPSELLDDAKIEDYYKNVIQKANFPYCSFKCVICYFSWKLAVTIT